MKKKSVFYNSILFSLPKKVSKSPELPAFILSYLLHRESLGTLPIIIGIKQPRLLSLSSLLAFTIKLEMFMDMNLFSLFVFRYPLFEKRFTIYEKPF